MYLTLEPLAALAMTKQDEWMDGARKRRQWGRSGLVYDSMKKKQKRKIVEGFGYYGNIKMTNTEKYRYLCIKNGGNLEIRKCMSRVIVCLSWGCAVFRIFIRDPKICFCWYVFSTVTQYAALSVFFGKSVELDSGQEVGCWERINSQSGGFSCINSHRFRIDSPLIP